MEKTYVGWALIAAGVFAILAVIGGIQFHLFGQPAAISWYPPETKLGNTITTTATSPPLPADHTCGFPGWQVTPQYSGQTTAQQMYAGITFSIRKTDSGETTTATIPIQQCSWKGFGGHNIQVCFQALDFCSGSCQGGAANSKVGTSLGFYTTAPGVPNEYSCAQNPPSPYPTTGTPVPSATPTQQPTTPPASPTPTTPPAASPTATPTGQPTTAPTITVSPTATPTPSGEVICNVLEDYSEDDNACYASPLKIIGLVVLLGVLAIGGFAFYNKKIKKKR